MKNKMIKRFSISLLTVLSLFVSTVAACACAHHQVKTENESPSCHQISHEKENSPETSEILTSHQTALDASCICFVSPAPKVFGKSETLKIQKQTALFASEIEIIYGFVLARAPSVTRFEFSTISLSDSSYNIKSPRAPPRL